MRQLLLAAVLPLEVLQALAFAAVPPAVPQLAAVLPLEVLQALAFAAVPPAVPQLAAVLPLEAALGVLLEALGAVRLAAELAFLLFDLV